MGKQLTKKQERTADLKSFSQRMMVAEISRNSIEDYNFRKLVRSGVLVRARHTFGAGQKIEDASVTKHEVRSGK